MQVPFLGIFFRQDDFSLYVTLYYSNPACVYIGSALVQNVCSCMFVTCSVSLSVAMQQAAGFTLDNDALQLHFNASNHLTAWSVRASNTTHSIDYNYVQYFEKKGLNPLSVCDGTNVYTFVPSSSKVLTSGVSVSSVKHAYTVCNRIIKYSVNLGNKKYPKRGLARIQIPSGQSNSLFIEV